MNGRNAKFGNIKPNHFCNGYYAFQGTQIQMQIVEECKSVEECQEEYKECKSEACQEEVNINVSQNVCHEVCHKIEEIYEVNENFSEKQNIHEIVKSELSKNSSELSKNGSDKVPRMRAVVDAVLARIKLKKQSINGWNV